MAFGTIVTLRTGNLWRQRWISVAATTIVCLELIAAGSCMGTASTRDPATPRYRPPALVVNQVGYFPTHQKIALLVIPSESHDDSRSVLLLQQGESLLTSPQRAEVVEVSTNQPKLSIGIGNATRDHSTSDLIRPIDFTTLKEEGTYYLRVGNLRSFPFTIGVQVFDDALTMLLRSFYLQRCGVLIDDPKTGIYHPACHTEDGRIARTDSEHQAGDVVPAVGGWHDAGDYGKYVSTTTVTIGRLLHLYEQYPMLFDDERLAIPESRNHVPDILDEVRVGLDWLFRMQRGDGAVYRKLSGQAWPQVVAPHLDTQRRWLYGASTADTAKFAAAMALASRIYRTIDASYADACLHAAVKAWKFLSTRPDPWIDRQDTDDTGSGPYVFSAIDREDSLLTDSDDRVWAATELFRTTHEPDYLSVAEALLAQMPFTLFEWKDPSALAIVNYLSLDLKDPHAKFLKLTLERRLVDRAKSLLAQITQSGYRLANHRFIWGSNKLAAEEGISLFLAYRLTGNSSFLQGAIDQIDFLFGRNPFNQSFVTGIGTSPVRHVDHIFGRAAHLSIPGLLVGGPNSDAQDHIAPAHQNLLSYVDDERSYATNEYAIDYNASLIGLLGLILGEVRNQSASFRNLPHEGISVQDFSSPADRD